MSTTTVVLSLLGAVTLETAQPPADECRTLARVDSVARDLGRRDGGRIWPGFRPDTIPVAYVLPGRGLMLVGWTAAAPAGFTAVTDAPGMLWRGESGLGAASTAIALDGRPVAQVVVHALDAPHDIVATAIHEGFHAFAGAAARDGRRFGTGENAIHVASYPVFDARNEALVGLEGGLLARALAAATPAGRRSLARDAMAVRRERHARLSPEYAAFDDASEMNEGLAQYAYWEALDAVARRGPPAWRSAAAARLRSEHARLDSLTADTRQSFRLRYYATGAAVARLLDLLDGPHWKTRLMARNWSLTTALAAASGVDDVTNAAIRRLERSGTLERSISAAAIRASALERLRRAQADSVLRRPGVLLVLTADSLPARDFQSCGFDPQNLLQVSPRVRLHTRWWRPCGGGASGEFNVPSVHDAERGTVRAVMGLADELRITSDQRPIVLPIGEWVLGLATVRVTTPRVSVQASRADLRRRGDTLFVRPRP